MKREKIMKSLQNYVKKDIIKRQKKQMNQINEKIKLIK